MKAWIQILRSFGETSTRRALVLRAIGAATISSLVGNAMTIGAPFLLCVAWSWRLSRNPLAQIAGPLIAIELFAFLRAPLRYGERLSGHALGLDDVVTHRRWLTATVARWDFPRWSRANTSDLLQRSLHDVDALADRWVRCAVPLLAAAMSWLVTIVLVFIDIYWRGNPSLMMALVLVGVWTVVGSGTVLGALPLVLRTRTNATTYREARQRERHQFRQDAVERSLLDLHAGNPAHVRVRDADDAAHAQERRVARRLDWLVVLITQGAVLATALFFMIHPCGVNGLLVVLVALTSIELVAAARAAVDVAGNMALTLQNLAVLDDPSDEGAETWPSTLLLNVHGTATKTGQRLAITGPSGSGKSTLLRRIAGLDATSDDVALNGRSPRSYRPTERARHVAYVPTEPQLMSGAAVDVVRLGRPNLDDPSTLYDELGLTSEQVDGDFAHASRGQRHRVALLRALVARPDLLVLDEPTAGLGARERDLVLRVLANFPGVLVIATHDEAVAAWCDQRLELA